MRAFFPKIRMIPTLLMTSGDVDQTTPLRLMEKTDFFTREVDEKVLQGEADLAIHSAKDLPATIPEGLVVAAITKGVDPADSLVFRQGFSLTQFPIGGRVGTSSLRREKRVRQMLPQAIMTDLRGSVPKRLELLEQDLALPGSLHAIVVAEAALIRLESLVPRVKMAGEHPLQGKLAVLARKSDPLISSLFSCIDAR